QTHVLGPDRPRDGARLRAGRQEENAMPDTLKWVALGAGAILLLLLAQFVYLAAVLGWEAGRTRGLAYYGLPPADRERFKATLRRHARLLYPILALMRRVAKFTFEKASFRHEGV